MSQPPVLITASGISRRDTASGKILLQPTDFSLANGDRTVITGPSGSGKSVLLRTLALLDPVDSGSIAWCGAPISVAGITGYRRRVSYLGQRPALREGTVADNLRYPYSLKVYRDAAFDRQRVLNLLEQAGRDADFLAKRSSELSGGEAQIAALVRVLQLDPQVILLDEPTSSLDPESARRIESLINAWFTTAVQPGKAYVWVSHDPEQALRMGNRQLRMHAGLMSEPS